ncbi:hypothetical protein CPB86DRAFT_665474, partial [Serendipita vermifera]
RFPCASCGKMCTSRPRAHTCLLNHFGLKPFACNGACGKIDCLKAYASKAHLKRHCTPHKEKMTKCLNCGVEQSKQNLARHRKNC